MAGNLVATLCRRKKTELQSGNLFLIFVFFLVFWAEGGGFAFAARGLDARILGIRQFSTESYARIVLIVNREVFAFNSGVLKSPTRIFIDIPLGRIERGAQIPKFQPGRSIVSRLRFGKPEKNSLRLVVDIAERQDVNHRIFTLPSPQRIVIDVWAKSTLTSKPTMREGTKRSKPGKSDRARRAPPAENSQGG